MKFSFVIWGKRIAIALAALIVAALAAGFWLLASESGARFAIARAESMLGGKLTLTQAHGALAGPLELHGVRYADPAIGIEVKIDAIRLDYDLVGLVRKRLHVRDLAIEGLDVALTTLPPAPQPPPTTTPSLTSYLTPPLDMLIDRLHVGAARLTQDGKPLFASDTLDAAAAWTSEHLTIDRFALRAPDGRVDLAGAITAYQSLAGQGHLDIDWKIPGEKSLRAAGRVDWRNDAKLAHATLSLQQPLAADVDLALTAGEDELPWRIALSVPAFDPATLAAPTQTGHDGALHSLALQLTGNGDRHGGALSGAIEANAHRLLIDPLTFASDGKTLTLDTLRLRSPEMAGLFTANANVRLDATPVGGKAHLAWDGVELPADLIGQKLLTHGEIDAVGDASKFSAHGALSIGPPQRVADLDFALDGTPDKISLAHLRLKQPNGGLDAGGEITLAPGLRWNLKATAKALDPGAFAKDWPGAMSFRLASEGGMEKDGPAGKLELADLQGTLRQRALGGSANLAFAPPLTVDGDADLHLGKSRLTLAGEGAAAPGVRTALRIGLAIDSLDDFLPNAQGSVHGALTLAGNYPKLDVRGSIDGAKLLAGQMRLQGFTLDIDVKDLSAPSGSLALEARTLAIGERVIDSATLHASGTPAAHKLALAVHGKPLALDLALDGALKQNPTLWRGTLGELSLTLPDLPHWQLARPTALAYDDGAFSLDPLCLSAGAPNLCASASRSAKGEVQAKFSLAHLPLAHLVKLAGPTAPVALDGELDGSSAIAIDATGAMTGNATIASAKGTIAYPEAATKALFDYRDFHIDATLSPTQNALAIAASFNGGSRIDGRILTGAPSGSAMPLSGDVEADIEDLGFLDLLTTQIAGTQGKLHAKLTLSGTTARPGIDGALNLTGFATEAPAAGLKLHDGSLAVRSRDGENFDINGALASNEGKLRIRGTAGIAADAPLNVAVQGEGFLAADIPGAKVYVSPDLKIERDAQRLKIGGSLTVPRMFVDVSRLPGGAAAAPSPDVVVTDDRAPLAAGAAPVEVDVTVKLGAGEKPDTDLRQGTEVHLIGYGLNANLGGQLIVQQTPGQAPLGRGQITVNGTFKAYGQDLTIEQSQGRLLFAGTPVENPGLDIRAVRNFPDQNITVGLQVGGTALTPALTVFSSPAMEQSDALSYLVAGKPLSQLKGGDGNAVSSAASALGTAGGDLLAKSIGAKMGLDDVGVADNSAVGGAALTVGKYLSPRLYLGYGVGLFTPGQVVTLRYKLTRLFDFEMQNGTLSSRAGINYRIEK